MRLAASVLLRVLPVAVPLLALSLAGAANSSLACSGIGKRPEPCFVLGLNIQPYLAAMDWWGTLLWIPGLLISAGLLSSLLRERLPSPWGKAG